MGKYKDGLIERMLTKPQLIKNHYYAGTCRNASIAKWDGEKFIYWREKFGNQFLEDIEYYDENSSWDGFIPLFDLGTELKEIP